MPKKYIIFSFLCLIFNLYFLDFSYAQEMAGGLASEVPIVGEARAGDVICSSNNLFTLCDKEYHTSIYGVVTDSSALEIRDPDLSDSRLVATSGIATVRVSSKNGSIEKGKLVTTSTTPGVAQLATVNGYVLGTAIEDFTGSGDEIGRIQVVINIHPAAGISSGASSNLLRFIREGITVPVFQPVESLRYLIAALMVIISFILGMTYFGRSSARGIEAIGRNPLAKRVIQITIFINSLLTFVIVLSGLLIAYLILVL